MLKLFVVMCAVACAANAAPAPQGDLGSFLLGAIKGAIISDVLNNRNGINRGLGGLGGLGGFNNRGLGGLNNRDDTTIIVLDNNNNGRGRGRRRGNGRRRNRNNNNRECKNI